MPVGEVVVAAEAAEVVCLHLLVRVERQGLPLVLSAPVPVPVPLAGTRGTLTTSQIRPGVCTALCSLPFPSPGGCKGSCDALE